MTRYTLTDVEGFTTLRLGWHSFLAVVEYWLLMARYGNAKYTIRSISQHRGSVTRVLPVTQR